MPLNLTLRPTASTSGGGHDPVRRNSYPKAAARLQQFLTDVAAWTRQHAERVAKVYLSVESDLNLYVVARSAEYDFTLRSHLTEFIATLKDQGYPAYGSIIPDGTDEELQAFFKLDSTFLLRPE